MAQVQGWYAGPGPAMGALVQATWQASVLVVMVLLVQALFGRWLSARWRYALWSVVVLRLMLPVTPGSVVSVFNLFRGTAEPAMMRELPAPPVVSSMDAIDLSGWEPVAYAAGVQASEPVSTWSASDVMLTAWLIGAALVLGVLLVVNAVLAVRLRRRAAVADGGLLELLESCRREMGVRRGVRLVVVPGLSSPALAGVFRPKLLIPPGVLRDLSREELRYVLLHELAHVKKHDIAMNWLLIVLAALHWFNPLVWFAFGKLRADRELARDALVLRAAGAEAGQAYGRAIIRVLERLTRPRLANPALAGIGDGMGQLKRRMRMIALAPKRRPMLTVVGVALLATLAAIGLTDAAEPGAEEATSVPVGSVDVDNDPRVGLIGEWRSLYSDADPVVMTFAENDVATITDDPNPTETYNYSIQGDRLLLKQEGDALEFTYRLMDEHLLVTFKGNTTVFVRSFTKPTHVSLDKVISAHFDGNRLDNVIDYIRNATSTNIYVNWRAMEAVGVARDTRITLRLDGPEASGRSVLARVLEHASGNNTEPVTFGIRDRVVVISTQADVIATQANYPIEIPSADKDREATTRALKKLNQPIPINFEANRLANIFDYFSASTGVNVFVNWPALEDVGVEPDTLISLMLNDIKATEALRLVLHQASYGTKDRVEFRVIDGVITVSTSSDLPSPPTLEEVKTDAEESGGAEETPVVTAVESGATMPKTSIVGTWRTAENITDPVVLTFDESGQATITDEPHPTKTYDYAMYEDGLTLTRGDERLEFTYRLVGRHLSLNFQGETSEFERVGQAIVVRPDRSRELRAIDSPAPVNFFENRLEDAIEYLRQATGANIFVDWAAVSAQGVRRDTKVTLAMQGDDVTGRSALSRILELVSRDDTDPIRFAFRGDVMIISVPRDIYYYRTGYPIHIPDKNTDLEATEAALAKLRQPIPIKFEDNGIGSVFSYFSQKTGVPFSVDWPALKKLGVDERTPITLALTDVGADEALRLVLHQVSYGFDDRIEYRVIDGQVRISVDSALPAPPTMADVRSQMDREAGEKLRQPMRVGFDETPFEDVVQSVRDQLGVPVFANWPRLEQAGIEPVSPVTMSFARVPGDRLLHLVFQQLAVDGGYKAYDRPTAQIIDGVVQITTERDLIISDTRVYDIRQLLLAADPGIEPLPLAPRADGTVPERAERERPSREQLVGQIATLIRETVGYYDEWEANGGEISSIGELNGNLVIQTTGANHEQIKQVLSQLGEGIQTHDLGDDEAETVWRTRFNTVYRLNEREVVKRIAPPFIPEREEYYRKNMPWQAEMIDYAPNTMRFRWPDMERPWSYTFGRDTRIERLMYEVLGWQTYDFAGSWELLRTEIAGDWLYDPSADAAARRDALTEAIQTATGRRLSFELKPMEQQVIVAKGHWAFSPLRESYNPGAIHIYVEDELDPDEGAGGSSGDIGEFFTKVGSHIGMRFENQVTEPPSGNLSWGWHRSSKLRDVHDPAEHAERLRSLLDNLTKQTGLTFTVDRRVVDVWVITER